MFQTWLLDQANYSKVILYCFVYFMLESSYFDFHDCSSLSWNVYDIRGDEISIFVCLVLAFLIESLLLAFIEKSYESPCKRFMIHINISSAKSEDSLILGFDNFCRKCAGFENWSNSSNFSPEYEWSSMNSIEFNSIHVNFTP